MWALNDPADSYKLASLEKIVLNKTLPIGSQDTFYR